MASHQKRLFKRELSFQKKKKKLARPIILPEAEVLQLERQGPELQIFLQLSKLARSLRLPSLMFEVNTYKWHSPRSGSWKLKNGADVIVFEKRSSLKHQHCSVLEQKVLIPWPPVAECYTTFY
jgi:hypothetical protein